jgi:hypothetical protein
MSLDHKAKQTQKQMNTITICVPRIKLFKFMDYKFVEHAFEAVYGKDCVRSIGFFPMVLDINGKQFYKLEVTVVCTTEEALDMRSKLNAGEQVFLEVPFYKYVEGVKVEKKHVWKCVKLSFNRPRQKVEGDYHEWSRKLQLLQPVPASVTKLEQLLRETAECARACRSNVDDALLRARAYATTVHDCSPSRSQELAHFEEQLERMRWHSNSIVHCLGSASEQVPHMKSSLDSITRVGPQN